MKQGKRLFVLFGASGNVLWMTFTTDSDSACRHYNFKYHTSYNPLSFKFQEFTIKEWQDYLAVRRRLDAV